MEQSIGDKEQLSEQYEAFYKFFSDEVDKKFSEFETELNEKKFQLIKANMIEIKEVEEVGKNLSSLEKEVFGEGSDKKSEDVINYKKLAQTYITKCEELESNLNLIKECKISEIVSINKRGLALNSQKLAYLKKFNKLKGISVPTELKWQMIQKKPCTFDEGFSKIIVDFTSCWNDFHSTTFNTGINEIYLQINNTNSNTDYSIGITNETFNGSINGTGTCIGCQTCGSSFVLKKNGIFNVGTTILNSGIVVPTDGELFLKITVDCETKQMTIEDDRAHKTGPFTITGKEFKVTFGQCTNGNSSIKFVDRFD